jgi:serine/threonine protein kinase
MNTASLAPQLRDVAGSSLSTEDRFDYAAGDLEGDDLESLVEQTGPMPPEAAAECVHQALTELAHAHDQRLTHGDLTASDLILDYDGILRIANLGGAPSTSANEFSTAAMHDLHRLAGVLRWLLVGQQDSPIGTNGHAPKGAANSEPRDIPPSLTTLYRRLAAAGGPQGFASAAQALAFLENGEMALDDSAAPCTCGEERSTCCAGAEAVASSQPATQPLDTPVDMASPDASGGARLWLYGSIALTAAMLLAIASYLLWH